MVSDAHAASPISCVSGPPFASSLENYSSTVWPDDGFNNLLNSLPQNTLPPETDLTTLTVPSLGELSALLCTDPGEIISDGGLDWASENSIQDIFGSLEQVPAPETVPPSNALSQDERQQKLNLLANLKEAVVQLEAEIATMW